MGKALIHFKRLITEQVCEPGKSFKKDCNLCRCSNDGKDYACTRKSCPGVHTTADGSSRKKRGNCLHLNGSLL